MDKKKKSMEEIIRIGRLNSLDSLQISDRLKEAGYHRAVKLLDKVSINEFTDECIRIVMRILFWFFVVFGWITLIQWLWSLIK